MSYDLVSPGLSGCEATQFAVAATNQNAAARPTYCTATCHRRVTGVVTGFTACRRLRGLYILIGRSHGELCRFTVV